MQTFIAFPASERLHNNTQAFIGRMKGGATKPEPKTLKHIMTDFTNEALQTFFVLPANELQLSSGMMRIVNTTVSTINGASGMVVKRTAPKLNLAQNKDMAQYMDIVRICLKDDKGDDSWQVAFPMNAGLKAKAEKAFALLEKGDKAGGRQALVAFLNEMTNEALLWYFENPTKLLHLGAILSRLTKVSTETIRKASKTIINRVVSKLEDDQLDVVGEFVKSLMVDCEPRFPEQNLG